MLDRRFSTRDRRGRLLAGMLSLGLMGFALLCSPATFAAEADSAATSTQQAASAPLPIGVDYRIHPGDLLSIQVFGEPSLTQQVSVLPDGNVSYPLIGRLHLAGLSPQGAATRMSSALSPFVRHPSVTIALASAAQYTILVLGNVKTPGKYLLRSDARVADALAAAGGLGATNGDLPVARISHGVSTPQIVSLQRLFRQGDIAQNVSLADGVVVYVPSPATFEVEVVGAVDHPGNVQLSEGDHLSMAIARAGNSTNSSADLNHIRVTRTLLSGKSQAQEINLYRTLEQGDLSVDIPLQKGDVVYVPQSRRGHGAGAAGSSAIFLLQHLAGFPFF